MTKERLIVSEMFYSLQGEGATIGHPAVFLRLAACNLNCLGFSYRDPMSGEHLGCDTKLVWKKGSPYTFEKILLEWETLGWLEKLNNGTHLVITGGEPLLQQEALDDFLCHPAIYSRDDSIFTEIETNATILPNEFLSQRIHQFNVSPKLSSSLESREKAYQPKVLQHFANLPQAIFKFVIQSEADVQEIIEHYQKVFNITADRIWLMPEGGNLKDMQEKMRLVAEQCKKYCFNFSPRLHIHIWDEATGV